MLNAADAPRWSALRVPRGMVTVAAMVLPTLVFTGSAGVFGNQTLSIYSRQRGLAHFSLAIVAWLLPSLLCGVWLALRSQGLRCSLGVGAALSPLIVSPLHHSMARSGDSPYGAEWRLVLLQVCVLTLIQVVIMFVGYKIPPSATHSR